MHYKRIIEAVDMYEAPRVLPKPTPPEGGWAPESAACPYVDGLPIAAWVSWRLQSAGVPQESPIAALILETLVVARTQVVGPNVAEYLHHVAGRAADHYADLSSALLSARSLRDELVKDASEKWRPISEAPKDGTKVWGYCIANGIPYQACIWWRGDKYTAWKDDGYVWRLTENDASTRGFAEGLPNPGPTHWMPLPEPPKSVSDHERREDESE